jgi:hypothetical protein
LHYLIDQESIAGAVSTPSFCIFQNGANLECIVYFSQFVARRARAIGVLTANTAFCVSVEFDGGQALETDRFILTLGNVKQTLVFTDDAGTPGTMPTTLVQPTGTTSIGKRTFTGGAVIAGQLGRNLYTLGGPGGIPGGGLLTSAQRLILMNLEPMV